MVAVPVQPGARFEEPSERFRMTMARTVPTLSPVGTSTSLETTPQSLSMSTATPEPHHQPHATSPAGDSSGRVPSDTKSATSDTAQSEGGGGVGMQRFGYPHMPIDDVLASLNDDYVMTEALTEGSPQPYEGPSPPWQPSYDFFALPQEVSAGAAIATALEQPPALAVDVSCVQTQVCTSTLKA